MNKDNTFFQNLKQWSLKVSVSSIIFVSVMLLGGAIITLALPSSLDDVKSQNTHYQLNAENWDYVVDQISGQTKELTNLRGTVSTLSGIISKLRSHNNNGVYYTGNVGIGAASSASYKTLIYNNTSNYGLYVNNQTGTYGLYVTGTGRNYLAGNLGIGTTSSTAYKLNVSGSGNFSWPLYAPTPTANSTAKQVATKEYVDSKVSNSTFTINVPSFRWGWKCGSNACPQGYSLQRSDKDPLGCITSNYYHIGCKQTTQIKKTVNIGTTCATDWKRWGKDKHAILSYTEHKIQADGSCKGGTNTTHTINLYSEYYTPELGLY